MKEQMQKGMWKRTFGLFRNIRIPWQLYVLQVVLGILSTKVALLYIPYETDLKLGNIEDSGVLWGYIGFQMLSVLAGIAASIPAFYSAAVVKRNLQNRLIGHSLRLPLGAFEKNGSRMVSWITQDSGYAEGLLTSLVGFLTGMASVYMSVAAMSAIDVAMIYIVPFLLVYIVFSTWLEGKFMFLRERRGRRADAELTAYLAEHLGFFTQIRQLHSQKEESRRGKEAVQRFYQAEVYQAVLTLVNNFISSPITNIITILVFVMGVPRVNDGSITIEELAAFQNYILIAYGSLSSLPGLYTSLMYYNGQLFYISGLMAEKEEVYERNRTMDMPDADLTFCDVTFGYGEKPVVEGASFTVPHGKTTLLVGPNGSGKSTLFKLIERFYTPDSGRICFGERDAQEIHLKEWRQSVAYVLQEPQLFDGTIRENINYGMNREVSQEETRQAARMACAEEFIQELPGGYEFEIGENGCRLSAGQRQRIAIARAVMLDPAYLLLDEATCNLDIYAEMLVTEALVKLMKGRTTLMISHDMKMLERAEHVVVLNQGRVEAEGTREEVQAKSEILRKLIIAG